MKWNMKHFITHGDRCSKWSPACPKKKKDVVSVCYLGHKVLVKHLANILESILYQKEIIKNEIKAHENLS